MTDIKRNTGIDLLRIVSMCMIIVIHMNGYGKASELIDVFSFKYFLSQAIAFFVACSVNVYAMISGFVGGGRTDHKSSIRRFLKLWLHVFFYSILFMLVFKAMYPAEISKRQMLEAALPAMSMQYWYFTFYIPVLFLIPYLNQMISNMDIVIMRGLIAMLFLFFSAIPWIFQTDWFGLDGGFSVFWLIILYLFGAWLRKESEMMDSTLARCRKFWLSICIAGLIVVQVLLRYMLDKLGETMGVDSGIMHAFNSYTSPFIVLEACAMVILFGKMKLSDRKKSSQWITELGAASFGVYLIHDNQFFREYIIMDHLVNIGQFNIMAYVMTMIGVSIGIYAGCAVVELIRKYIGCKIRNLFAGKIK